MVVKPHAKRILKVLARTLGLVMLFLLTFSVAFGLFIFASPKFRVTSRFAASLVQRYAPENLKIGFSSFALEIDRPEGQFWSKTVVLEAKNLCVQYEKTAVDVCIGGIRIAATGGFDGPVLPNQSKWYPHIQNIEPLQLTEAVVHLDLTAFPNSTKPTPSKFDWLGFFRKEVLPKWDVEGSHVNVTDFLIKTAPDSGDQDLEAVLHHFRQVDGPLSGQAKITVTRPQDWGAASSDRLADGKSVQIAKHLWRVYVDGDLNLDSTRKISLKGEARIRDLQRLEFKIQTLFKGIDVLQEARFDGSVKEDEFTGVASLKAGSKKGELQALDFVNCGVTANLEKKEGSLRCGPQSVRMQIRERSFIHRPDLFILAPELELKVTNLKFGDKKSGDYSLNILMDHLGIVRLGAKLSGQFETGKEFKYSLKGRCDFVVPLFSQITEMLKSTPYAIPAPFNTFDGVVGLQANVDFNQNGGGVTYQASTRLDSDFQSMHLDIAGKTNLERKNGTLVPNTDVTLTILALYLSAPRFELRTPPAFKPDSRFGTINQKVVREKLTEKREPGLSRFKLHVKTASPEAIRIATNLTKSAIPLSVDAVYDDHSPDKSPVTGSVLVGRTPVELFKRNAVVENIRVDLLGTGDNRLNGLVSINYGDYAISILLLGQVADPQVRFVSDPPLDDDQIVSVLLFGRPQRELGDDEQNTVSNTKAAMADAVLGLGSLYFLASTPIQSVGYDPDTGRVIARVGLGGGASIELGAGGQEAGSGVGFRKRISKDFSFRTEVETLGSSGSSTVLGIFEWVKRF
jgi:hypothetical protein